MGTIRYVATTGSDANDGTTTAQAKLTISAGCLLLAAGDTCRVLPGSYQGSIYVNDGGLYANGTSTSPITLLSYPQFGARIRALSPPAAGSGNKAALEVRRNWWVIDGFEVTGQDGYSGAGTSWIAGGTEWAIGIDMTGSNCVTQNCWAHDLARSSAIGSGGGAGINCEYFYGGTSDSVLVCKVHDIGSALTAGFVHGIYISQRGALIKGNLVYNIGSGGAGIHGWHGMTGGGYVNNTVFNAEVGLLAGQGDAGADGIGVANFQGFNNIVLDCNIGIDEQGVIGTGNVWSNNIVYRCNTAYGLNATSTAVNKISLSPTFVNYISTGGGDYHLSVGSAAVNAGIASLGGINALTFDLDGVTRPNGGIYDLGAYELATAGPDITPPILTLPVGSALTYITGLATVVTNEGTGICYCWVTTNPTETAANIVANGMSVAVSLIGTVTFSLSGLNASTTYYAHFCHEDAALNRSTAANSASFTTLLAPAGINALACGGGSSRRGFHIG